VDDQVGRELDHVRAGVQPELKGDDAVQGLVDLPGGPGAHEVQQWRTVAQVDRRQSRPRGEAVL
jgi:hypothetical protein